MTKATQQKASANPKPSWFWRHRRGLAVVLAIVVVPFILWVTWAENNPEGERELRLATHDWLEETFPEEMALQDGWYGLFDRSDQGAVNKPRVVLVHGLDEPGVVWGELMPVLIEAGYSVSEFHYPNDDAVDSSTAYLVSEWHKLAAEQPVVLIGHSMGGLLIREFVSAWRHPVEQAPRVAGASVLGVILVGTPNQGSHMARLRIFTEMRDQFKTNTDEGRDPSILAPFKDGTGAAKVDLRPGSVFLTELNQRPWPPEVRVDAIAGVLADNEMGDVVGDGAVTLESARLPELVDEPHIVTATHRGLVRRYLPQMDQAPAIPIIVGILADWSADVEGRAPTE